jgi:hypothetical protein
MPIYNKLFLHLPVRYGDQLLWRIAIFLARFFNPSTLRATATYLSHAALCTDAAFYHVKPVTRNSPNRRPISQSESVSFKIKRAQKNIRDCVTIKTVNRNGSFLFIMPLTVSPIGLVVRTRNRFRFSAEEDEVLKAAVDELGDSDWHEVALRLPGRQARQVRDRYNNYLRSGIEFKPWTEAEDEVVREQVRVIGPRWAQIAKHALPNRTPNAVKNRWKKHLCYAARRKHGFNDGALPLIGPFFAPRPSTFRPQFCCRFEPLLLSVQQRPQTETGCRIGRFTTEFAAMMQKAAELDHQLEENMQEEQPWEGLGVPEQSEHRGTTHEMGFVENLLFGDGGGNGLTFERMAEIEKEYDHFSI